MLLNDSSSLFVFFFYSDDPTTHRHVFTASGNNNVKFILPQAHFDYNVYDEYVSMSRTKTYRLSYRAGFYGLPITETTGNSFFSNTKGKWYFLMKLIRQARGLNLAISGVENRDY